MRRAVGLLAIVVLGCGGATDPAGELPADGEYDSAIGAGKADAPWSDCEVREVLAFVNDPDTTDAALKAAAVHTRARRNILDVRNGPDGLPGTEDDERFDTGRELDDVPWVGPKAFQALVAHVADRCLGPDPAAWDVVFSPQPYERSHLTRVAGLVDAATRSIDIAMYSFRDGAIMDALTRAVARGVSVRMVFQSANDHRKDPGDTRSDKLEEAGVDVRWINKIMHHKFALLDGPRDTPEQAATATLASGSANWSSSAGTRFDENTLFIVGNAELNLRFQREFNHLWEHSREFVGPAAAEPLLSAPVGEADVPDDPDVDAVFTSANFEPTESSRYGPGFRTLPDSSVVADRLVELIGAAEHSIHVASGHLRSRPVAEALLARWEADPGLDIRVYLDGQEYLGSYSHSRQLDELDECLEEAGDSETKRRSCLDKGFLFSHQLHLAGIPVRFKYYAYRWDYTYAPQMHHKYLVVDGEVLATGSYNLSDNAEHNTMENVVFLQGPTGADLTSRFEANFSAMWDTGRAEGGYDTLLAEIEEGQGPIPLVFSSLSLTWDEIDHLKRRIRELCPAVDSEEYRRNASAHRTCDRP